MSRPRSQRVTKTSKRCPRCKVVKKSSDFGVRKSRVDGLSTYCKSCSEVYVQAWRDVNREKVREYGRKWIRNNPEKRVDLARKRDHRVTRDTFAEMYQAQNGLCAICKRSIEFYGGRTIAIDHDHQCCPGEQSCGRCVRGILCRQCNTLLGDAGDSVTTLSSAIGYLEAWNGRK